MGGGSMVGLACAISSSVAIALSYTSLRALASLPPTTTLMALYGFCLTAGVFGCMFEGMEAPSAWTMALLAALSVVSYAADWLITMGYALATEGAGSVAIYKFLTPIFALVFDIAFFQISNALNVVGVLLVVAASTLMLRVQTKGNEVAASKAGDLPTGTADALAAGDVRAESGAEEACKGDLESGSTTTDSTADSTADPEAGCEAALEMYPTSDLEVAARYC
jgi:hypothetical protein